ncbi:MAG: hypothetical protein ND866_14735 [Pyrinomonadaceae bacterium]|nr:hypothetical protein [Pyrinomonadaceae bacterium]
MKHCPQCEFTFDDRQELCDFDGSELRVVPEKPPSFKSVSLAPAASGLSVRRLVRSPAGLAVLAVTGVALSALLIGYYDAANQPNVKMSASQTGADKANSAPSTQVDPLGQVASQTDRPKAISTQRRIGADELTSSMVKRLLEGSGSRSIKLRRGPSTSKQVATKRGPSSSKRMVAKRKTEKVNRNSQARNQARPRSRERGRQQHSTARVANQRAGWVTNESAHHSKGSKVVGFFKKTGSILKKPFELIVNR